jgi:hypothetical protein
LPPRTNPSCQAQPASISDSASPDHGASVSLHGKSTKRKRKNEEEKRKTGSKREKVYWAF